MCVDYGGLWPHQQQHLNCPLFSALNSKLDRQSKKGIEGEKGESCLIINDEINTAIIACAAKNVGQQDDEYIN